MEKTSLDEILSKLVLPGYMKMDIVRIKVIPREERELDGPEIKIINSFGEAFLIKKEQLENSGYTHSNGEKLKFKRMTSKKDLFGFRECNEPVQILYIAKGHPMTLQGNEIENKYIVIMGENIKICSPNVFRKMFTVDNSEKYQKAKEVAIEKKIPLFYTLSNRIDSGLSTEGYLLTNNKNDNIDSFTTQQVIELAENLMIKDVTVKNTSRGKKLIGSGIDRLN